MQTPIYSIKDLHVSIKNQEILNIKQFDIHRGACYALEGRMGSGKTTFLEILYSRRKIYSGEITYEEKNINHYSNRDYLDQIAIVPQKYNPPWGLVENYISKTIEKYTHVANPGKNIADICRKMKLNDLLNRKMRSLTPGELRWVVLAAQIGADTKVLFIDEIEMHLCKKDLNHLLSILHKKINYDGVTLIASTQNKDLISRISSVTITLEQGRITSLRSPMKKKEKYRSKNNKK